MWSHPSIFSILAPHCAFGHFFDIFATSAIVSSSLSAFLRRAGRLSSHVIPAWYGRLQSTHVERPHVRHVTNDIVLESIQPPLLHLGCAHFLYVSPSATACRARKRSYSAKSFLEAKYWTSLYSSMALHFGAQHVMRFHH